MRAGDPCASLDTKMKYENRSHDEVMKHETIKHIQEPNERNKLIEVIKGLKLVIKSMRNIKELISDEQKRLFNNLSKSR